MLNVELKAKVKMIHPGTSILKHFQLTLIADLGGRLNQHWLVERRHERLVLQRWAQAYPEITYELGLLERIAAMGWPVAAALVGPIELQGHFWSLAPLLPGTPMPDKNSINEQRSRGHVLAAFHADLSILQGYGQRGTWRRCEAILADTELDKVLTTYAEQQPEESTILRWHLQRARERITAMQLYSRPGSIVHGDFTQWNLHFIDGKLTGILDFELAHWDHRIADFALAWRGAYDHVIQAYNQITPLEPEEWTLLTPMWWAFLIELACQVIRQGKQDDGWIIKQLLRRSALMGPDAAEYAHGYS